MLKITRVKTSKFCVKICTFNFFRCRNGWNNNPTPLQFKYSLRRLLLHSRVDGQGGNCRLIDSTVVLSVSSKTGKVSEPIDYSLVKKYGLELDDMVLHDNEEYNVTKFFISLNEMASDVVAYIAGYVIKMLLNRNLCPDCLDSGVFLNINEEIRHYKLINRKDRGWFYFLINIHNLLLHELLTVT